MVIIYALILTQGVGLAFGALLIMSFPWNVMIAAVTLVIAFSKGWSPGRAGWVLAAIPLSGIAFLVAYHYKIADPLKIAGAVVLVGFVLSRVADIAPRRWIDQFGKVGVACLTIGVIWIVPDPGRMLLAMSQDSQPGVPGAST
ncbi:hypothetical protein [Palleronia salina]|uniref:hypothetical protein n=1 Tax=Palleronia salina TaxID=313368 RepID=UPI0009352795|nr:hypothetical protein [Palleronia salina]